MPTSLSRAGFDLVPTCTGPAFTGPAHVATVSVSSYTYLPCYIWKILFLGAGPLALGQEFLSGSWQAGKVTGNVFLEMKF